MVGRDVVKKSLILLFNLKANRLTEYDNTNNCSSSWTSKYYILSTSKKKDILYSNLNFRYRCIFFIESTPSLFYTRTKF